METVANLDLEIQFGFATKIQFGSNVTHQYHCSSQLVPSLDRREEVSNYVVTILINFLSLSKQAPPWYHQAHSCARNTCFLPCTSSPPSNTQFSPSSLFFIIGHCLPLPSSTPGNIVLLPCTSASINHLNLNLVSSNTFQSLPLFLDLFIC